MIRNFVEIAELALDNTATLLSEANLSGIARAREKIRLMSRWMIHVYNMGRYDEAMQKKGNPVNEDHGYPPNNSVKGE